LFPIRKEEAFTMSVPTWLRFCAAIWLVSIVVIAKDTHVKAVPAFARKYQTSCQTCHTIFPKLNAFGEAFRLNGYKMPGETEEMVKEKPVSLGAPAYKRLWPHAIWPGEISSSVPLAVNIKLADVSTSARNADGSVTSVLNDFQLPQEVNLFGAGTLGDHVSYFSELTFGANPDGSVDVEIEHAHIAFDSPFGKENLFHFRIGKFAPNLEDRFQEMWIMTDAGMDSLFNYNPIGVHGGTSMGAEDVSPPPIELPALVQGIECYGIINHRLMYVTGLVNGIPGTDRFDGNNAKDVYARLDYKFGGMGLDGDTGGKEVPVENWRDNSVRIGALVYRGDGSGINFAANPDDPEGAQLQDTHFLRTGLFGSVYIGDLNVFGVYLHGTDSLQLVDPVSGILAPANSPSFHASAVEADYVFYPWLQGAFRYEAVKPADPSVPSFRTGVFNLSALIRANVKAMLEYQRDFRDGANHSLNAVIRFAF
jgi:hypothetical protein